MKTGSLRRTFFGVLCACIAVPGLAVAASGPQAGPGARQCSFQGTWFGVVSPENLSLTGWVVTVEGKSENAGTNNLEYPTFEPTLGMNFPTAVRIGTLRGAWERTGRNTFTYSFLGFALDSANAPVYLAKVSGTISLSRDCRTEAISASMAVYFPNVSPFDGDPLFTMPLAPHYGYRY